MNGGRELMPIKPKKPSQRESLMTLGEAIRLYPRPWIDGDVSIHEWILAGSVIQAAIARDEGLADANKAKKTKSD